MDLIPSSFKLNKKAYIREVFYFLAYLELVKKELIPQYTVN